MPNAEGSSAPAPTGPRTFLRIEYVPLLAIMSRVVDRGKLRRRFPRGKAVPGGRRLLVVAALRVQCILLILPWQLQAAKAAQTMQQGKTDPIHFRSLPIPRGVPPSPSRLSSSTRCWRSPQAPWTGAAKRKSDPRDGRVRERGQSWLMVLRLSL
jgi:hypothetical protein